MTFTLTCSSAAVVHAAAVRPAVPSVNSWPSLVSGRSLHFLEHSARWCAVRTVCLFLPATAKDIPVSPVISGHHSLNFRTTLSWTLQQFRLFSWLALTSTLARLVIQEARTASDVVIVSAALYSAISRLCTTVLSSICAAVRSSEMVYDEVLIWLAFYSYSSVNQRQRSSLCLLVSHRHRSMVALTSDRPAAQRDRPIACNVAVE